MPATLHFSNSLDALADRLIANLDGSHQDPFETVSIATPASAVRDWLKVRIAEKTGIAANLAFPPLENMLWERLAERDRFRLVPERKPARLLEPGAFQGLVLAHLRGRPPEALRAYLAPREDGPQDAARRLCQLSGRLASLFREYEYNRVAEYGFPGVAESWMRGEPCFEHRLREDRDGRRAELRAMESWQMEIYRALFRPGEGLRDRWGEATKVYRYTLPQYAELALAEPETPPPELVRPVFHLFGLSHVSPFHRDLIGRLADAERLGDAAVRFEIYAFNPCAEFWEDALSLRERRARGRRSLTAAPVPRDRVEATRPNEAERAEGAFREEDGENGLLALFGKPGRETIKLWCQLTDHDFLEEFREPPAGTLLSAVRASMLHRAGPLRERVAPDGSLRLRRAPDPRAEIAAARAECAALLHADATLRPEDLAILVADAEAMLPLLRAAFAGGPEAPDNLPVLLPEGGVPEEHPLLRGMHDLFTLGGADTDRRRVLAFLDNPLARAAAGLEDCDAKALEAFLEAAGFQEGWEGDGPATVDAAVERALLSFAMDPDDPAVAARPALPPAEGAIGGLGREEAGRALAWLDALRRDTRPLRDGVSRAFPEWATILRGLKERFLRVDARETRADFDLARFFEDLESWGGWGDEAPGDADALLLRTLFEDRFREAARAGRASFLRGGVRVGSLSALRGLPFRHVWILGLSSDFPASAEAAPLDLRAYRRIPGESDPAARDLYALLETVAATSGSVSLSWAERAVDGGERQASRALTGLMAWLETDILPEGARPEFEEWRPRPVPPPPPVARAAISWAEEPARARAATDWRRLREFLDNPAAHAVARRFHINVWEILELGEDAPTASLFLAPREDDALLTAALRAELAAPGGGLEVFNAAWDKRQRGGRLPPPPYDGLEEERLRFRLTNDLVNEARALREALQARNLQDPVTLRLGPQGLERAEPPVRNAPALDAAPLGISLRVGGLFPWFFRGNEDAAGWAMRLDKGREFPAYLLRLCADALELPATLSFLRGPASLFVRDPKKPGQVVVREVPAFGPEQAREILFDLLSDYLRAAQGEDRLEDLPLTRVEAVLKDVGTDSERVPDWTEALAEARRAAEEAAGARASARDKLLRAIDPSPPDDPEAAVRRRILPYLDWRRAVYARAEDEEGDES